MLTNKKIILLNKEKKPIINRCIKLIYPHLVRYVRTDNQGEIILHNSKKHPKKVIIIRKNLNMIDIIQHPVEHITELDFKPNRDVMTIILDE